MFLVIAAICAAPAVAQTAPAQEGAPAAEVAVDYNYLHVNAPPGGCGCFSMDGGNAAFAYRLTNPISVVAQLGAVTTNNANGSGHNLTLSGYQVGGRYSFRHFSRITPFTQSLVGIAHASGTLAPSRLHLGSDTAFAMSDGGGLDVNLSRHFAVRAFQAEYLLSMLPNRTSNHQNNVRFGAGVVVKF
jgi:peptidoglycan-associated lipoprotein